MPAWLFSGTVLHSGVECKCVVAANDFIIVFVCVCVCVCACVCMCVCVCEREKAVNCGILYILSGVNNIISDTKCVDL